MSKLQTSTAIFLPNGAARIVVCLEGVRHGELCGHWRSPYCKSAVHFDNIIELLSSMETFYNALEFPQSTLSLRSFGAKTGHTKTDIPKRKEVTKYMSDEVFSKERGEKATFIVQVQFRQNATWQGTVTWAEKNETCHFRSALELLKMMDETLSDTAENAQQA
ncbi:MAG: hypothetical protein RSF90_00260 [Pygmaiobacter sp.]